MLRGLVATITKNKDFDLYKNFLSRGIISYSELRGPIFLKEFPADLNALDIKTFSITFASPKKLA